MLIEREVPMVRRAHVIEKLASPREQTVTALCGTPLFNDPDNFTEYAASLASTAVCPNCLRRTKTHGHHIIESGTVAVLMLMAVLLIRIMWVTWQ